MFRFNSVMDINSTLNSSTNRFVYPASYLSHQFWFPYEYSGSVYLCKTHHPWFPSKRNHASVVQLGSWCELCLQFNLDSNVSSLLLGFLVLGATGTFVATPMNQTFTPFVNPIMNLNPSLISSIPGGPTGGPGQGQLCQNCNCNNCMNNLAYEEERGRAIKMTLERNPTAFHPKIGRGEGERKHTKGCNCKRSGCLKNYCECYEAKISCSDLCRCQGCRNTEDSVERRSLMRLAAMGALRSRQPSSFKKHLVKPPSETLPHVFFTWEVIEATASCLLAQADEAERRDLPPAAQERILLEEFGRTLERVIEAASKAQIRSSSAIHTSASIDDNDQGLIHSGGSTGPGSLGGKGSGAVGVAAAAAAAADVLRDDEDDEDEMMHDIDVEEEDDPDEMDDEMYGIVGGSTISRHGHSRSHLGRRHMPSSHRSTHLVPELDDDIMSDEDPVERAHAVSSSNRQGIMPHSLPHVFFTWEVIEATASCLLAQADEAERRDLPPAAQERILLEEFGRTLERVIEAASKAQIRSSSAIHTSASIDDNDQGLIHSGGSTGPGSLGGKGSGAVGVAAAAAAAADVLRDDEDDEDEMMHDIDVEEEDDPDEMDDEMYGIVGGSTISRHGHSRSHLGRRHMPSSHRSTHLVPELDDDIMSDEDPVERAHAVSSSNRQGIMPHRYQEMHSRRTSQTVEDRYIHSRRNMSSRSYRHHDPDSMV
ncbi:protein lin-54 [Schistosoma bovis]|uniref:Protein lin-54 n=1 Tax=Schistosoma bovis TaxID=6184 RepID=A0A430Q3S7_SCHBO|nr:protein lin-54 [Schistosoma bovis]